VSAADAELVRRAQRGDRDALGELYARYAPVVHGHILAHSESDDAEDLVQDAFATALEKISTLRDADAFGGWVCAMARNAGRMSRRQTRRLEPLPDTLSTPGGEGDRLDGALVLAAIRSLPEAYRDTLVLRLVEQLSGNEIAARTGLTPASVRVNLHRGMAMLRDKFNPRGSP
jgi:RNA polymerase sigma-70 factor, ECF subfamily